MRTRITADQYEASITPTKVNGMSEAWETSIDRSNERLVKLMRILENGRDALYYKPMLELRALAKEIQASKGRSRDDLLNNIMSEARQADRIVQLHAKL